MNEERYAVIWCGRARKYYRLALAGEVVTGVAAIWRPDGSNYWEPAPIALAGCVVPDVQIKPPPDVDAPPPVGDPSVLTTRAPLRPCAWCGTRHIGRCDCARHAWPCSREEHRYQCIYCREMKLIYISGR